MDTSPEQAAQVLALVQECLDQRTIAKKLTWTGLRFLRYIEDS